MAEINGFPIFTKTVDDLDYLSGANTSPNDSTLIYDESVGVWKKQTANESRVYGEIFFPTVVQLQQADLAYDLSRPVYVSVEETGYRVYKIQNTLPGPDDILLNNGNVAVLQKDLYPRVYDTVSSLAANLSLSPLGSFLVTKGCLSVGDGGGGNFIVTAASGTPDGYYRVLLANGNHAVLQAPFNFKQFGAVADFNSATLTGTDNSPALARMIAALPAQEINFGKGDFGIGSSTPIVINNPMKWVGVNRRFGTRLFFMGTGPKSVRTQVKHPDDGLDAPMSAGISIESPQVHFEDIYFSNAFNGTLPAGNYGSDWDTIIFNKSYSFFTMNRCRVDGYARVAGIYYDVTRNAGNCDGSTLTDCWFQGFWGCKVQGPKPKTGETEILSGDTRGGGGFSDFTMNGSTRFFDMNHHSGVRASDTDGGAFYIDGYLNTPAKAIQGHKFISTRFTSFSPWLIYIGRSSRDLFDNAHFERATGRFKADGVTPAGNADVLIQISSEARYTSWVNGTVDYNCTTLNQGALFYRDASCISGTSGGQALIPPIVQDVGQGNYSPVISSSVGGDLSSSNYTFSAIYVRLNDGVVTCQGRIALSSKAGLSGNISIKNFVPFANRNVTNGHLAVRLNTFNVGFGAGNGAQALVNPNQTTADVYLAAATGTARLTDAELANNSIIHFSFTYVRQ